MKAVLSIAGSDPSGGAGIQADIKTIAAHQLYAETAITALTVQNTMGVTDVIDVPCEFVAQQIDAVFADIRPDAVKVGMVSSAAIIETIAGRLRAHGAANIVIDPVMVSTSGSRLIADDAVEALVKHLIPLASIITPNIPEAEVLCGEAIETDGEREAAAMKLAALTEGAVLVKGGHGSDRADDVLVTEHRRIVWLRHKLIETENTHGTGCTLSTAIACNLASDFDMQASVQKAKHYVTGALQYGLDLGKGCGPLNHMWDY